MLSGAHGGCLASSERFVYSSQVRWAVSKTVYGAFCIIPYYPRAALLPVIEAGKSSDEEYGWVTGDEGGKIEVEEVEVGEKGAE